MNFVSGYAIISAMETKGQDKTNNTNNTNETSSTNETAEAKGSGLAFDEFAGFLNELSDDVIKEMLSGAGFEDEKSVSEYLSQVNAEDDTDKPKKPRRSRFGLSQRLVLLVIVLGLFLLPFALNKIYLSASLNGNDPITYSEATDNISCSEGQLVVNNVKVQVPSNGKEKYNISYAWAEDDKKYPSVPQSISAIYQGEEGAPLYDISLYRSETIVPEDIPEGKKASNWFEDWERSSNEDTIVEKPLTVKKINGFYIYPAEKKSDSDEAESDYNNYSYYFATQDKAGIRIYVLEGVCYDVESADEFSGIMDKCIRSIKISDKSVA